MKLLICINVGKLIYNVDHWRCRILPVTTSSCIKGAKYSILLFMNQ